jgi:hypothetical protein
MSAPVLLPPDELSRVRAITGASTRAAEERYGVRLTPEQER